MSWQLNPSGDGQFDLTVPLMRSNRAVRDGSWVARLIGRHPRYKYQREFLKRTKQQDRPTRNGEQVYHGLREGEVYEYRDLMEEGQLAHSYRKGGGESGFFRIVGGGIEFLDAAEVGPLIPAEAPQPEPPTPPTDPVGGVLGDQWERALLSGH